MSGRVLTPVVAALLVAASAAPAFAADRLYYVYDPEDANAKMFTGVTTFVVKKGLFGKTPVEMYAQNGRSVRLTADGDRPFSIDKAAELTKAGKDDLIALYKIDGEDGGKGFARAACRVDQAWIVVSPFERYAKLKVQIVGWDPAKNAAFYCNELAFRYRGEYAAPKSGRLPINDGNGAKRW